MRPSSNAADGALVGGHRTAVADDDDDDDDNNDEDGRVDRRARLAPLAVFTTVSGSPASRGNVPMSSHEKEEADEDAGSSGGGVSGDDDNGAAREDAVSMSIRGLDDGACCARAADCSLRGDRRCGEAVPPSAEAANSDKPSRCSCCCCSECGWSASARRSHSMDERESTEPSDSKPSNSAWRLRNSEEDDDNDETAANASLPPPATDDDAAADAEASSAGASTSSCCHRRRRCEASTRGCTGVPGAGGSGSDGA